MSKALRAQDYDGPQALSLPKTSFQPIVRLSITLHFLRHVLSQRKAPSSTLAWLFIVMAQPYLGGFMYVLLGGRKIHLAKPKLNLPKTINHDFDDPLITLAIASGAPAPRSNAGLQFITNGVEAYHLLLKSIQSAKKSIYLETYLFAHDQVGMSILSALTKKAEQGLDVRILLDSFGALITQSPSFKKFTAAGGKFIKFMPLLKNPLKGSANLRNHRKLVIVDEEIALSGGMNIASEYMGPVEKKERWIDQAMMVQGDLVSDMVKVFRQDWAFAAGEVMTENEKLREREKVQVVSPSIASHLAQLIASGPDLNADPIYEWLLTAIYSAKKSIWITTPYFIPDESLTRALEMASKRGLDVRLITPARSNHLVADLARMTYLNQMEEAGAKILLYEKMIHAKVTLIDQQYAFAGSANMDTRSLLLNYELGIALYSPEDIEKVRQWFIELFPSCSHGVKETSRLQGLVGSVARLMSPLL